MKGVRILLIDNHELVRRGVRSMLEQEKDMEIVGECPSAEEAIFQMVRIHPDIALMDTQLPGMNWIEAISNLKKSRPVPVLMSSSWLSLRIIGPRLWKLEQPAISLKI